jgi:hypothetical protein
MTLIVAADLVPAATNERLASFTMPMPQRALHNWLRGRLDECVGRHVLAEQILGGHVDLGANAGAIVAIVFAL